MSWKHDSKSFPLIKLNTTRKYSGKTHEKSHKKERKNVKSYSIHIPNPSTPQQTGQPTLCHGVVENVKKEVESKNKNYYVNIHDGGHTRIYFMKNKSSSLHHNFSLFSPFRPSFSLPLPPCVIRGDGGWRMMKGSGDGDEWW